MKKKLPTLIGICLCILFMEFRDIGHYPDKIWLHRCNLELLLSSSGRRMLSDPQLKVVLVKEKGSHHR